MDRIVLIKKNIPFNEFKKLKTVSDLMEKEVTIKISKENSDEKLIFEYLTLSKENTFNSVYEFISIGDVLASNVINDEFIEWYDITNTENDIREKLNKFYNDVIKNYYITRIDENDELSLFPMSETKREFKILKEYVSKPDGLGMYYDYIINNYFQDDYDDYEYDEDDDYDEYEDDVLGDLIDSVYDNYVVVKKSSIGNITAIKTMGDLYNGKTEVIRVNLQEDEEENDYLNIQSIDTVIINKKSKPILDFYAPLFITDIYEDILLHQYKSIFLKYKEDDIVDMTKDITELFNQFKKDYVIFGMVMDDDNIKKTPITILEEHELRIVFEDNLQNLTDMFLERIFGTEVNEMPEELKELLINDFKFGDLENIINQALTKFSLCKLTVYGKDLYQTYNLSFDVYKQKNNKLLYEYDGCDGQPDTIEYFKNDIEGYINDSIAAIIIIRVKTDAKMGDLPYFEVYGFKIDSVERKLINIDYDKLRESYASDAITGEAIELAPNDIYCDLKGNKTGILID